MQTDNGLSVETKRAFARNGNSWIHNRDKISYDAIKFGRMVRPYGKCRVNELFTAMLEGQGGPTALQTMAALEVELKAHLTDEEALMTRINYPDLAAHRADHLAFGERFHLLVQALQTNGGSSAPDVLEFIGDWLSRHVLRFDKAMAQYINSGKAG